MLCFVWCKVRESVEKIVVKGTLICRDCYWKLRKFVLLELYCVTLALLYITSTNSGPSFELVPVNVITVNCNLKNSGGMLAQKSP